MAKTFADQPVHPAIRFEIAKIQAILFPCRSNIAMTDEKPTVIFLDSNHQFEPMPFPTFFTCEHPRTPQQIRNTQRRWEADAVFGFYKLKLSAIDQQKMDSYLDGDVSADELIQRFTSAT